MKHFFILLIAIFGMVTSGSVLAHAEVGVAGGLISGLMHPILGPDHLIAMVAVGLWGAQLRNPAIFILPMTFPLMMAMGGLVGMAGIPLPMIEIGIALSAVALGLLVALQIKLQLVFAIAIVAIFAIFHGHAHGTELPNSANPLAYSIGFVVSTGLLHLAGILIGEITRWPVGNKIVRACGGGIAGLGVFFLAGHIGLLS